jgi:tetratricopeptide (TPR) repeat protein
MTMQSISVTGARAPKPACRPQSAARAVSRPQWPLVASLLLTTMCACQNPEVATTGASAAKVEVIDESPQYSPQDRLTRFRQAYDAGLAWIARGEYGLALAAFEESLRMRPDSIDAMFNLAGCYEQIGEPTRAIALYKRILAVSPNDAECYHNLGTSYIKLYHLEKSPTWRRMAQRSWQRSLELNPQQPKVHDYLARIQAAGE